MSRFFPPEMDHPRGCGENFAPVIMLMLLLGSPPRMRGKPITGETAVYERRITPADAGKTAYISRDNRQRWDHPRGCGENHTATNAAQRADRITPADAGKTSWRRVCCDLF